MVKDIHEALVKCGVTRRHDPFPSTTTSARATYVVSMVMEEIHKMGFKNITPERKLSG